MLQWTQIKPVLIALVSDLLRKPAATQWQAAWAERRDASQIISPEQGGTVTLKITTVVGVGNDDSRYEEMPLVDDVTGQPLLDEDGNPRTDLFEEECGLRRFTLQLIATEMEYTDEQWALATLSRLATRIDGSASRRRLLDVNVDLTDVGAVRDITTTIGGRRQQMATLDLTMTGAFSEIDPVPVGFIEHVVMTTHSGVEGVELPAPPNLDNEVIPPAPHLTFVDGHVDEDE